MLQAYAPRDPLREASQGKISVRQLRVMVEHLPPGNPAARVLDPWRDTEHLLHDISTQLRGLNVNFVSAMGGNAPEFVPYPKPETAAQKARVRDDRKKHDLERAGLAQLIAQRGV